MSERPTPITDLEASKVWIKCEDACCEAWAEKDGDTIDVVDADFARDLERQLAEAREQISELETRHAATMLHTQAIADDANLLREQRDRLADACKKLMKVIGPPNATIEQCWAGVDEIDEAYVAGEQALAAVNRGPQ